MQVYRGMDIGTAKPTIEERQGIQHSLIDIRNPDEEWTVSDFVRETQTSILKLQKEEILPIIVGGTGLYLWALLEGFAFPISPADEKLRKRLEQLPNSTLFAQLSNADPSAASKIHPNDKKRLIRALEVYELTGKPISELQRLRTLNTEQLEKNYNLIGLNLPREELCARINQRVDQMLSKGLIKEVERLLAKGYSRTLNSFQALGYKEVVDYFDGKYNREQMIDEIKKRTRNFARRQMTWFRRFKDVRWFIPSEKEKIMDACYN